MTADDRELLEVIRGSHVVQADLAGSVSEASYAAWSAAGHVYAHECRGNLLAIVDQLMKELDEANDTIARFAQDEEMLRMGAEAERAAILRLIEKERIALETGTVFPPSGDEMADRIRQAIADRGEACDRFQR